MSDKPLQITRNQLAEFLPNARTIKAFEQLINRVTGEDVSSLDSLIVQFATSIARADIEVLRADINELRVQVATMRSVQQELDDLKKMVALNAFR